MSSIQNLGLFIFYSYVYFEVTCVGFEQAEGRLEVNPLNRSFRPQNLRASFFNFSLGVRCWY